MNAQSNLRGVRGMLVGFPVVLLAGLLLAGCPTDVVVPDVVGLQLSEAELAILGAGLTVGTITTETGTSAPDGQVLEQYPGAGTLASFGWSVDLVVAVADTAGDYDQGFEDGFAEDEWYYEGYYDSQETLEYGPIQYEGDDIPNPLSPEYDRGYWDGVWTAYNDGYFDAYDDAFEEGFYDGYYTTYAEDYVSFLLNDIHIEYGTGGYTDGYNDGFSEGRVFGAYDWINYIDPDWESALADYREGLDLCVLTICTGEDGPVELYEYGTNPALKSAPRRLERPDAPSIRKTTGAPIKRSQS